MIEKLISLHAGSLMSMWSWQKEWMNGKNIPRSIDFALVKVYDKESHIINN